MLGGWVLDFASGGLGGRLGGREQQVPLTFGDALKTLVIMNNGHHTRGYGFVESR